MGHPNEELVRRGYDAFAKGDIDTLRALLDPEVVWHQPGRSVLAGDHRGIEAVLGFFATTMELTAGSFREEPHDVIAGDQHVVGLHLAWAERRGRTFVDRQVLVVQSATARSPRCGSTSGTSTPSTSSSPSDP